MRQFPTELEYHHAFTITEAKTVPALYPEAAEFLAMPKVFATGFLVGLLEWTVSWPSVPTWTGRANRPWEPGSTLRTRRPPPWHVRHRERASRRRRRAAPHLRRQRGRRAGHDRTRCPRAGRRRARAVLEASRRQSAADQPVALSRASATWVAGADLPPGFDPALVIAASPLPRAPARSSPNDS